MWYVNLYDLVILDKESSVLYKLCDMWIYINNIGIRKKNQFYINYVICEC